MNGDTLVAEFALLLTANTADASYSGQSFCLWFIKNLRYCSNFWFICSVFLFVCGWKNVDNLVLIPNIQFNSLVSSVANYSPLSNITPSGNLYNFYTLFINNCTSPSTNVPSVVVTKFVILNNLSQTTRIASFPATNNNLVMKSTIKYVYGLSGTLFTISFFASISVQFFILWYISYPFTYFPTFFVTPSHQ